MKFNIEEITERVNGKLQKTSNQLQDKTFIRGVAGLENAKEGDLSFFYDPKYFEKFLSTKATAVLVPIGFEKQAQGKSFDFSLIWVENPYQSFNIFLQILAEENEMKSPEIHQTAYISNSAVIGQNVYIGQNAVIEENVVIGENSKIWANVFIGKNTIIGKNSIIYPNSTIYQRTIIGENCIIHSGTTIGSDGFGFLKDKNGVNQKIPQIGIVRIKDNVEIGANCTIDRATLDETVISQNVKIDNLVQIAHNVFIGENTVIAAQAGISGGTKIGKNCLIGGQVGFVGHLNIADGSQFGGKSGVSKNILEPNKAFRGQPAQEIKNQLKMEAEVRKLPLTIEKFQLEIERLEKMINIRNNENSIENKLN